MCRRIWISTGIAQLANCAQRIKRKRRIELLDGQPLSTNRESRLFPLSEKFTINERRWWQILQTNFMTLNISLKDLSGPSGKASPMTSSVKSPPIWKLSYELLNIKKSYECGIATEYTKVHKYRVEWSETNSNSSHSKSLRGILF